MKASDFRNATTEGRNFAAEALCDANAVKCQRGLTDYRKIEIGSRNSTRDEDFADVVAQEPKEQVPERRLKSWKGLSTGRSYATDAAFVARHLDANALCRTVAKDLAPRVTFELSRSGDSRWLGLFDFLEHQPKGTRIADVKNQACLSALIARTIATGTQRRNYQCLEG
jgi:hypothetical protein